MYSNVCNILKCGVLHLIEETDVKETFMVVPESSKEFNEIKISSLLLKGRSLPSLRAMKEDKVVPENVADVSINVS